MEAMKKEIARLNSIIAKGCMGEGNKKGKFSKRKTLEKMTNQVLDMLRVARQMKERSSRKRNVLNSRALDFCLPRPQRFQAQSLEVPESGSVEPHRQPNPEVLRKLLEVPRSVKTEQRRKARLSISMFSRHLTLVKRCKIIQ
jgi:hypothetical protein